MSSHPPVIEVSALNFHRQRAAILSDVSLRVERGEFLGVIGPNGGGKTTLLRVLLGLESGYTGEVKILGERPSEGTGWRTKVGVVPQNRDYPPRFPVLVREIVEMGTRAHGASRLSRETRRERVMHALQRVGAETLAERPLWQLSGGQKQRVFVARALASEPELLLLDEPTVGVDAQGQDLLLKWIAEWRNDSRLSVVLITHDIGVIAPIADKIACLNVSLHFHDRPDRLTGEALEKTYGCPAELIFHSGHAVPHRVVGPHSHE